MVRQNGGALLAGGHRVEIGEEPDGILAKEQKHCAEADPGMQSIQVAAIAKRQVKMDCITIIVIKKFGFKIESLQTLKFKV